MHLYTHGIRIRGLTFSPCHMESRHTHWGGWIIDRRYRCALGSSHSTISCPVSWWGVSRWRRQKPPCPTWTSWRPFPLLQLCGGEGYRMIWNSFLFLIYITPVPVQQPHESRRINCERKHWWVYYSLTDYFVIGNVLKSTNMNSWELVLFSKSTTVDWWNQ